MDKEKELMSQKPEPDELSENELDSVSGGVIESSHVIPRAVDNHKMVIPGFNPCFKK